MNTRNLISRIPVLAGAAAATAVLGISACAAATPAFNPDRLQDAQLSRVTEVCRNVMGLSPAERLVGGEWLGDAHLDYWTSRYRGCVTSLSDSVQSAGNSQADQQADSQCRTRGYASGSPDLALCVLDQKSRSTGGAPTSNQQGAEPVPAATDSLFYASGPDRQRREELACAAVGIEPVGPAFKGCVNDLQKTFHAIDTPIT